MTRDLNAKDREMVKRLNYLINAMDKAYPPLRILMIRSFIQGIFVGLGTTVGLSIVLAIAGFILKLIGKEVRL